jgi:hypothetical protein
MRSGERLNSKWSPMERYITARKGGGRSGRVVLCLALDKQTQDDKAAAVKVTSDVPTLNTTPHVTVAISPIGMRLFYVPSLACLPLTGGART